MASLADKLSKLDIKDDGNLEEAEGDKFDKSEIARKKDEVRQHVWSLLQSDAANRLKPYPPECAGKIPNFKKSNAAAFKVTKLREFRQARVVKVNPSLAQMNLRKRTIEAGKTLIVPAPAMSPDHPNGGGEFMFKLEGLNPELAAKASTKKGGKHYGTPMGLESNWKDLHIEIYVVAAVAVTRQGVRLGKGLGYAEIEWGILTELGAVDPRKTLVVTTVDDLQVVDDAMLRADDVMDDHDLPVDVIVTPTRIINVRKRLPKPCNGILWNKLSPERLEGIPVLKKLKDMSNLPGARPQNERR